MTPRPASTAQRRVLGGAFVLVVALAAVAVAQSADASPDAHKVTLCHATGSYSNPYVTITVDFHSVIQGGHGQHDGPVFFSEIPKHTEWGDIIPPFDLGPGAEFAGQNWTDEGQAVFNGDCSTAPPSTTTTTNGE